MARLSKAAAKPEEETASQGAGSRKGVVHTGEDIFDVAAKERAAADARRKQREASGGFIRRFRMPVGEERRVVLLDKSLRSGRAYYEHTVKENGQWTNVPCIKESANCPLCKQGPSSFTLHLTALDLTPYTIQKGQRAGKVIPFSKVEFAIKSTQLPKFQEIEESVTKKHGTLRGTCLVLKRPNGSAQNSASIGEPCIVADGRLWGFMKEDALKKKYGNAAVKGDGKTTFSKAADADITPYDYKSTHPAPDIDDILARFGNGVAAGSDGEAAEEWSETGGEEASTGKGKGERPAAKGRRASKGEEDDNPFGDD